MSNLRFSQLAGWTLLLAGLVAGCTYVQSILCTEKPQDFPTLVLSLTSHQYEFNWDRLEANGHPLKNFFPERKYWRVQVFRFSDGVRVGENGTNFYSFEKKETKDTLKNLPFDRLLRVDLDFQNKPKEDDPDPDATTVSLMVLLHDPNSEEKLAQ